MNIFGVGGWELLLIITIALIVAGPKRLAVWAYHLGQWAGKLQNVWGEFADSLQKEMDEAGVGIQVPKTPPTRQDLTRSMQDFGREIIKKSEVPIDEMKVEAETLREQINTESNAIRRETSGINGVQRADMVRREAPKPPPNGTPPTEEAPDPPPNGNTPTETPSDDTNSNFGTWGGK